MYPASRHCFAQNGIAMDDTEEELGEETITTADTDNEIALHTLADQSTQENAWPLLEGQDANQVEDNVNDDNKHDARVKYIPQERVRSIVKNIKPATPLDCLSNGKRKPSGAKFWS